MALLSVAAIASKAKQILSIDVQAVPVKAAFVVYGAVLGLHVPFLNVFLVSVGLRKSQAGFITGIRFAASAFFEPVWGVITDITGRRKLILVTLCFGSAVFVCPSPWVAKAILPNHSSASCDHWNITAYNATEYPPGGCQSEATRGTLFVVLLTISVVSAVFIFPLVAYVDTVLVKVVKSGRTRATYGAQRLFGSLGFSIASFLGGVASDHYNYAGMSKYTPLFYMLVPALVTLVPLCVYLVNSIEWNNESSETRIRGNKRLPPINGKIKDALLMLRKFDIIFFLITVFIGGLANATFLYFSFSFINDTLSASKTEMTLTVVVGSVSEIIMFPFTSKLMKALGGTIPAMVLSLIAYLVRYLAMTYTNDIWIIIALQSLHGIGFALGWSAMIEHTYVITPKKIYITAFSVLSGTFYSFSAVIGNIAGGKVSDVYGVRNLFRAVAILCGAWGVLMTMYYGGRYLKDKRGSGYEKLSGDNEEENDENISLSAPEN